MSPMLQALYDALYVEHTVFQWTHFTPYGVVRGRISKDFWNQSK